MESDNARSVSYSSDKFPPPSLVQARLTHTGMILYENLNIKIKVEKILKGSLDLIPSPSVKIQIMQCFALLPQVTIHANDLNFHWRWGWWDRIQAIFVNLLYFKK